jgi:hypothetical protein
VPLSNYEQRALLYQRALHYIPGSYKLWFNFLNESKKYFKNNEHQIILNGEKELEEFS